MVITILALTGTVALISKVIPIQAGVPIVVWIGIVITAQAYQATPQRHAPAVAIGLFPAVAAWGATVLAGVLISGGGGHHADPAGDKPRRGSQRLFESTG